MLWLSSRRTLTAGCRPVSLLAARTGAVINSQTSRFPQHSHTRHYCSQEKNDDSKFGDEWSALDLPPTCTTSSTSIANPFSHLTASTPEHIESIFKSNKAWAASISKDNPDLLPTLSKGQSPKILWIGCSDSRVPETTILGLKPGDVFVHRNIANILTPTDLSSLSVIEYAVVYLKVQHIVLCGHTSCGGVAAALDNKRLGKIDTWLMPLRQVRMQNAAGLESLSPTEKARKMVELNVEAGVNVLRSNPDVIEAVKERGLTVHGMVYDLAKGQLLPVELELKNEEARDAAFTVA